MMMTYYINVLKSNLGIQSISMAPDLEKDCIEVVFRFDESIIIGMDLMRHPEEASELRNNIDFRIEVLRAYRDQMLKETMWIHERHISQLTEDKSLSEAEYHKWQHYWQILRELPQTYWRLTNASDELSDLIRLLPVQPSR